MADYKIENGELVVFGFKRNINGNINIAGQTELYDPDSDTVLGKTSTGSKGEYEFRFPQHQIPSGRYELRFYGSNTVQKYYPEGDWEYLDIVNDIIFDVPDVNEIYEVADLKLMNASGEESGSLDTLQAKLRWEDIRRVDAGYMPQNRKSGLDGTMRLITYQEAQKVTGFEVYIYISDTNTPPANPYPSGTGWYYVGESAVPEMTVECPANKYVAFWVGMRWKTTNSQIVKNIY